MSDRVTCTITNGVADVRLNRPDKMNAVDGAMFAALEATGEALKTTPGVRAVVLSGEGRAFCAGLDFGSFQAMAAGTLGGRSLDGAGAGPARLSAGGLTNLGQHVAWVWHELAVPVIAAVHGVALGGGFQIALGADIRIVAPEAQMSVLEIRWGLIPDMTGTHMLARLVPLDVAKELTWTGRTVSGPEAVQIGLATKLSDDPRAEALELAARLAAQSPHAIRAAKRLLNQSGLVTQAQQYLDESREMGALIGSPNQVEAVTAYFARRAPVYADVDDDH